MVAKVAKYMKKYKVPKGWLKVIDNKMLKVAKH